MFVEPAFHDDEFITGTVIRCDQTGREVAGFLRTLSLRRGRAFRALTVSDEKHSDRLLATTPNVGSSHASFGLAGRSQSTMHTSSLCESDLLYNGGFVHLRLDPCIVARYRMVIPRDVLVNQCWDPRKPDVY